MVKQIFAEITVGRFLGEIFARRHHNPNIDFHRFPAPNPKQGIRFKCT